ncbi:hypothetical protein [Aeromonas veronii]|nr:hypothetical protein [Aeromonas veronii]MCX0435012.1 hypothetical protein [Aeromonas veronii]MCX0441581.1 hypothetical protein [Aeromonas veronii]
MEMMMCFLCGNEISLHSYNSLNDALANLQKTHDKLHEKYELSIHEKNNLEIKYLKCLEQLENLKVEETHLNDESYYIYDLPNKLSNPNIFSVLKGLTNHFNVEDYTLNDLDKLDMNLSELKNKLLNSLDKNKFTDIKIKRLKQRKWDQGHPIQVGFIIDVNYLSKDEIDVFRSLVRNNHSESVRVDDMDSGAISLYLKNGLHALIMFDFGLFGTDSTPSISFFTDLYNEEWEDMKKADDEEEHHFMVPIEITDLLSKLNFEVTMNRWDNLLNMK